MEVHLVGPENILEYEKHVQAHKAGTFLQSPTWGQWQETLGKQACQFLVSTKPGQIVASAQFLKIQTPLGFYLYSPYGPLINTELDAFDQTEVIRLLIHNVTETYTNALFIRLEPIQSLPAQTKWKPAEHIQPQNSLILNIRPNLEELLRSMHTKTRYNIRLAQKHGLKVEVNNEASKEAVDLIMSTASRQNYRPQPRSYVEKMCKFFADNHTDIKFSFYTVGKDHTIIASAILLDFGKTRTYLFGGSDYKYRQLMAPYLLHWQAIQDAKQKGINWYDFGGATTAGGKTEGFAQFKKGFGPEEVSFGGTWDIVIKPLPYQAYRIIRKVNRLIKHL